LTQQIAQNSIPEPDLFIKYIKTSPAEALHWLVRLPPTLPALDFATKILTSNVFESYDISPGDLARQHLQHMLRQIEAMRAAGDGLTSDYENDNGLPQQSTEEQARAVTLVVMYVRNLLARQIVDFETISLDIQEICIRYIWLPQVRDFRSWIEVALGSSSPFAAENYVEVA
jgi:CCR4-NOT transcription complex subunit 11